MPGAAFRRVRTLLRFSVSFYQERCCFSNESSTRESLDTKSLWFKVMDSGSASVKNLECPAISEVAGDVLDTALK